MGVNDFIKIGDRIKKIRQEKNIKQKEMAYFLDMPVSTYSSYENNHREPNKETIQKIAEILNVNIPFLIYGDDNIDIKTSAGGAYIQCFIDYCYTLGYSIETCLSSDSKTVDKYYIRKINNSNGEFYEMSVKQFNRLISVCDTFTKFALDNLLTSQTHATEEEQEEEENK